MEDRNLRPRRNGPLSYSAGSVQDIENEVHSGAYDGDNESSWDEFSDDEIYSGASSAGHNPPALNQAHVDAHEAQDDAEEDTHTDLAMDLSDITPDYDSDTVLPIPKRKKIGGRSTGSAAVVMDANTKLTRGNKTASRKAPIKAQSLIKRNATTSSTEESESESGSEPKSEGSDNEVYTSTSKVKRMADNFKYGEGPDLDLLPISTVEEAHRDLYRRLIQYSNFQSFLLRLEKKKLKIGTMCSGTESPVLALQLLKQFLAEDGKNFNLNHAFSAEIVPWKQAYINLNFDTSILYQDITELFKLRNMTEEEAQNSFSMKTAYSGTAIVPGSLTLLVAGTSCVDFSSLNNARKTLKDGGESGDTFYAMLQYVTKYRPAIVILENVKGAPWLGEKSKAKDKIGMDSELENAGYVTKFILLDTKNFYIPHTRLRGYMIAVDVRGLNGKQKQERVSGLHEWVNLVRELQRKASSPVEQWLFDNDDPRLRKDFSSIPIEDKTKKKRKMPDWAKCRSGHDSYRHDLDMGSEHPVTKWESNGFREIPSFWPRDQTGQGERTFDTIDISHLRNLLRGFDDRYFNRVLELSQNVYRVIDNGKQGIVGCLTPTGFPFLTTRGSKVTGVEALKLQGLPVDQLDLSRLSQSQMQNLSGNAMSSTVVGVCIFSALAVFSKWIDFEDDTLDDEPEDFLLDLLNLDDLTEIESRGGSYCPLTTINATAEARLTRRLCYCEGRDAKSIATFQECKVCRHTTCTQCGAAPPHVYIRMADSFVDKRKDPKEFMTLLKKSLPMTMDLSVLSSAEIEASLDNYRRLHYADIDNSTWEENLPMLQDALASNVKLHSITRREHWEVVYTSEHAWLLLEISDQEVRWTLYANIPKEPLGTPLGKRLRKFPIARMLPQGDDIVKGSWQLWLPKVRKFDATVTASGDMVKTYENSCGLPKASEDFVATNLKIEIPGYDPKYLPTDVRGSYKLSQACAQAKNTLHVLERTEGSEQPIFLFLDQVLSSGKSGIDHYFSFTRDIRRKQKLQYREELARCDPKFTSLMGKCADANSNKLQYAFKSLEERYNPGEINRQDNLQIFIDGIWAEYETIELSVQTEHPMIYQQLPKDGFLVADLSCNKHLPIFTVTTKTKGKVAPKWPVDKWMVVDRHQEPEFIQEFGALMARGLPLFGHMSVDDHYHPLPPFSNDPHSTCGSCAPRRPDIFWTFNKAGKQVPCEDPQQASRYERLIKARPSPTRLIYFIDGEGNIKIVAGINPVTLAHRAGARLASYKSEHASVISLSHKLITDVNDFLSPKSPKPRLTNNRNHPEARHPDETIWNMEAGKLRPEQLRALAWAEDQENCPKAFQEVEVVEARFNGLGYRIEGRATRDVTIRGGVLAFDVAFGKTAVVLGLYENQRPQSIAYAMQEMNGAIPIKATIVFVPSHLPGQWSSEITKFISAERNVITIKDIGAYKKLTVANFIEADIIIVNMTLLDHDQYNHELARFAAMADLEEKALPRAKRAWRDIAAQAVRENIIEAHKNPEGFSKYLQKRYQQNLEEANSRQPHIPSKRVTGSAYISKGNTDNVAPKSNKRKLGDADKVKSPFFNHRKEYFEFIKNWDIGSLKPLFEMFSFHRVVVDEYTYFAGLEDSIECLRSHSRWLLSGTPQIGSFSEVKKIANLIGINLGIDDCSSMRVDILKKKEERMTSAEHFQSYGETPTPAWQYRRMVHCQKFLDHYVRREEADLGDITIYEYIQLVYLPRWQWAVYKELEQHLVTNQFEKQVTQKFSGADSEMQIRLVLHGCDDGREALLNRATTVRLLDNTPHVIELDDDDSDNALQAELDAETPTNISHAVLVLRKKQLLAMARILRSYVDKICWLEDQSLRGKNCRQFGDWYNRLVANLYGDRDAVAIIQTAVDKAKNNYHRSHGAYHYRKKNDWSEANKHKPTYPEGMATAGGNRHLTKGESDYRSVCTALNRGSLDFTSQLRSVRFLENLNAAGDRSLTECDNPKCTASIMGSDRFALLSKCGHVICQSPTCQLGQNNTCPICELMILPNQFLSGSEILGKQDISTDSSNLHGQKLSKIVDFINCIPEEDGILIFVQFKGILAKLIEVVDAAGFTYLELSHQSDKSTQLSLYQGSRLKENKNCKCDKNGRVRILILNTEDSSASGSNLTQANHIIFVSPYYVKGSSAQSQFEATMTQAIGRVRRYGQQKTVRVHHFATVDTIDVDILEHRHKKTLVRFKDNPDCARYVDKPDRLKKSPLSSKVSHLTFIGPDFE